MSVIEAQHLYKIFGRKPAKAMSEIQAGKSREWLIKQGYTPAVVDASFSVEPGEIFVVMGLSGSGKSTLIRMINGLLEPTSGTIKVHDKELSGLGEREIRELRRESISMVFQTFALLPHRSVLDNAAYGLEIKGVEKSEREKRAREALEMVGLKGWGSYRPAEMSGGMKQRVGLARALAAGTDILLMDEAFSALDPLIRRDMQDQLIDLQHSLGKTIVFITHDLNEAMRLGDRIAMMRNGYIEQIGTAEEILNNPANDYVSKFVRDVDRTQVLTAENIMKPLPAVLGAEQGPKAAFRLMQDTQMPWLLVVNRDRTPAGMVWEDDVAAAIQRGDSRLPWSATHQMPIVAQDTSVAELFSLSAQHLSPIVVVDDRKKTLGVIPRVTLLAAAQKTASNETAPEDSADNYRPGDVATEGESA